MKKLLLVPALLVSMLFGQIANATVEYTLAFSDVTPDTTYGSSIAWMSSNGVIQGYEDGTFKPDQCVNRAEFLKMMYLSLETDIIIEDGFAGSNYYDTFFSDTFTDAWYWPYVEQALRNQTIEGYEDGTFKPGQCVNRAEAIKMAILEFNDGEIPNYEEGLWSFADVDRSAWYEQYMAPALFNDLVGREHMTAINEEGGNFYPGDSMSRKEVAEMLYRMKGIKDNSVEVYDLGQYPDPLNFYVSQNSGVSFLMPAGWTVIQDDYYTTAGGVAAEYPTIAMNQMAETIPGEETVVINQRMMECGGEFGATCIDIVKGYSIGAFEPSLDATFLMNKISLTFRENALENKTYYNELHNLSFNYPADWVIRDELMGEIGEYDQLRLRLESLDYPEVGISINTPPLEVGFGGLTVELENGFEREIEGLTANGADLLKFTDFGDWLAKNNYYIDEADWGTHISFSFGAPGGVFDTYLPDYYTILDSVHFN